MFHQVGYNLQYKYGCCNSLNQISRKTRRYNGSKQLCILTFSIEPISWMSFLSVGMKLSLTLCNCKYRSLNAESCPLKSNSWKRNHNCELEIELSIENNKFAGFFCNLLSNLRDNNMNNHLLSLQIHHSSVAFLCALTMQEPQNLTRQEDLKYGTITVYLYVYSNKYDIRNQVDKPNLANQIKFLYARNGSAKSSSFQKWIFLRLNQKHNNFILVLCVLLDYIP